MRTAGHLRSNYPFLVTIVITSEARDLLFAAAYDFGDLAQFPNACATNREMFHPSMYLYGLSPIV